MPKFRNGLAKIGRVYHYHFTHPRLRHHSDDPALALDAPRRCLSGFRRVIVAGRPGEPPSLNLVRSCAGVHSNLGVSKNMPFIVEISFSVA